MELQRSIHLTFGAERPVLVKPLRARRAAVEARADALRARMDLQPGADLEDAVARLGGRVLRGAPHLWFRGRRLSFLASAPDRFQVNLLAELPPERERLDLAHELGHLMLHDAPLRAALGPGIRTAAPAMASPHDGDGQRADLEAFWFAHALLMPEAAFRAAWGGTHDAAAVAARFGVPLRSAELRAEFLDRRPDALRVA